MNHRRATSVGLAGAAVAAVTLAGCTGYGNASLGPNVLTIAGDAGHPTLIENFNPYLTASGRLGGALLIYEPLLVQSSINGSFTPFLATGFHFRDPRTAEFSIRTGVTWSDGKPFSAADVVFTYRLLKKYPALDTNGIWAQVKSISSTGDTVRFTFKAPNVPYIGTLSSVPIVPQHIWKDLKDPTKYTDTKPVGTGPFELRHFAPTQYVLIKNPKYWQANKIAPDKVVYPATSSNNSTTQLDIVSGKFDWAYSFLPQVQQTYVQRDPATNLYWFPPGGTICLYLNLTKAPYTDVNFRRGLSDALKRSTIADKAVNGYLTAASQSGLILPNLKKWLDPSLPKQGYVTQDVPKAVKEFTAAGYTMRGGKLVAKNGKQFTMTITAPSGYSDWVAAAKEVTNQLQAVGIKVTLDLPEPTQYTQATQAGTFDTAFGGFGGTGVPYLDFNNTLNAEYATPINKPTAQNFERYKNPTVQKQLAALAASTSFDDQKKHVVALQRIMIDQVPIVMLYYGGSWGLFSTRNFTGWPSAKDPYTLPTSYNNAALLVLTHLKKT